jgi:quinate dehydrogenase
MLRIFSEKPEKGVVLDMCFKPRRSTMIKFGESFEWPRVEGTHVGYQIKEQGRHWARDEVVESLDKDGAWSTPLKAAEESRSINSK